MLFDDPEGAIDHVEFFTVSFSEQFAALYDGRLDVSTEFVAETMQRQVYEVRSGVYVRLFFSTLLVLMCLCFYFCLWFCFYWIGTGLFLE